MIITKLISKLLISVSVVFLATVIYADNTRDLALLEAVEKGDFSAMQAALDKGADINAKDVYQEDTALISAAKRGYIEIARELIKKGAVLNGRERYGATALMHASAEGHMDIARILIDGAADINIQDKYGRTALMGAAGNNQLDIVKLLLSNGAEVDAEDISGRTAWVLAVEEGNNEIAGLLKGLGAKEKYEALEWSGEYCSKENSSELIVGYIAKWEHLWKSLSADGSLPEIDFNKYVIAAVFLGPRPTGGYSVEFGQPYLKDNKMVIPYREHKPGAGQFVTQVFTRPYAIKVFEKKAEAVIFREVAGEK